MGFLKARAEVICPGAFLLLCLMLSLGLAGSAAGAGDSPTPSGTLDAYPHLWLRMAETLVERLYDPSLNLFRETWGTPEGRCWYWNTEQGEAAQIVVHLNDSTLLSSLLAAYRQYLTYDNGANVYLFSRYTPCSMIRQLSLDPQNFSLGNLIVNIGGDLAGTRTDIPGYHRVIALSLDIYKDPTNIYEQDKAWPNMWYTANLKSHEVWYLAPGDTTDYKGIWDTSDGSLGTGRITGYSVRVEQVTDPATNTTYNVGVAERTMEDANLSYTQRFILEPRKPYVKVELTVTNKSRYTLSDVSVALAFDNLDWWLYNASYIPGLGLIEASTAGRLVSEVEKEYHFARTWEGFWQPVTDSSGRDWWPSIIYADRPLGMNRGLLVLVQGDYGVHFWGYGNYQAPREDLYGIPAYMDWYFRWLKYEIIIGELAPGESKTVEVLIIPMSSYAPGLEDLYIEMVSRLDRLEGRDFSYAVNTGTGAFKGLAAAYSLLGADDQRFVERVIDSVGSVMEGWGWRASTRILANYALALAHLHGYTGEGEYLLRAEAAAQRLLEAQVRDPGDPRNGGFLDAVHPFGTATHLDVNAEAAHALLAMWERTGSRVYKEAVDYWLQNWFQREQDTGRWYYHRFRGLEDAGGEGLGKSFLDWEQPYALGYLLQALSRHYWSDDRLLASANRIWSLLTSEYWVATWEGAGETNVETQSSAAAGLREYLLALSEKAGAALEYVRGGSVSHLAFDPRRGSLDPKTGAWLVEARAVIGVTGTPDSPAVTLAVYVPSGIVDLVLLDGSPASRAYSLSELEGIPGSYYVEGNIVYVRLQGAQRVTISYRLVEPKPPLLELYKTPLAVAAAGAAAFIAAEASAPLLALATAGLIIVLWAASWLPTHIAIAMAALSVGLGLIAIRRNS
ncbi:hypothetical protein apy_09790 [Aeropyrum pernix]|uniref:Uncharacterized protein n=1 Tax=Aeropyrum pernix TaxID=56636 RepID=A0A401HA33_AERPX|nr:hypothetical protein [Aeropyrum pernix]GBF09254.1 hypothetical protein apy_09790 [Aeropyrum pernix]